MTLQERTALINRIASLPVNSVTLDGRPALVCGFVNDCLTVATVGHPRIAADFSWRAVSRVIAKGGEFRT